MHRCVLLVAGLVFLGCSDSQSGKPAPAPTPASAVSGAPAPAVDVPPLRRDTPPPPVADVDPPKPKTPFAIPPEPWDAPDSKARDVGNMIISCGASPDSFGTAYGVWGTGKEVWAAVDGARHGHAAVLRASADFTQWSPVPSGTTCPLRSVFSFGPDDVYVAGWSGMVVRTTDRGATFSLVPPRTANAVGSLWGSAPDDLWALGSKHAWHTADHGATWQSLRSIDTGIEALSLWGVAAGDVYLTGTKGWLMHTTDGGKGWTREKPPTRLTIYDVWGDSPGRVFTVGENGALLRKLDGKWERLRGGKSDDVYTEPSLQVVFGAGDKLVYAGGAEGTFLRSRDGGDTWVALKLPMKPSVYAIWADASGSVFVGGHTPGKQEFHGGHVGSPVGPQGGPILHSSDHGDSWSVVWRG